MTFGVVNCDHVLVDKCCSGQYGGRCTWFTDAELKAALARLSHPNVDIVYDARVFKDPDGRWLFRHTGHNHQIISRIISNKIFKQRLSGIHRKFHEAWGDKLTNNEGRGDGAHPHHGGCILQVGQTSQRGSGNGVEAYFPSNGLVVRGGADASLQDTMGQ